MRIREKCLIQRDGANDTLCDQSVYTRNRNFRLYYSSKCGKKTKLRWAKYDQFYARMLTRNFFDIETRIETLCFIARRPTHEEIFFDSMVVPLDYDTMPARVDVARIREREALIRNIDAKLFDDGVRAMKKEDEYEEILVGDVVVPQAKSGRRILSSLAKRVVTFSALFSLFFFSI